MKARVLFGLLLIVTLVLTACGTTPTVAPTTPPPATTEKPTEPPATTVAPTEKPTEPPKEPVELRMMWYDDGKEGEVMRDLLNRFEAANPGITVVMDTVAYKDLHNILQTQVEGGTPPDLARINDVPRFRGQYLDLTPYLSDAAAWTKNWPELTVQWMRQDANDKGLYGFPIQFTVTGPFINKTLFEQAGVAIPGEKATWDEWVAAAKEVAQKTQTPYAVAIDRTGHRFWGPSLSMCATYIQPDGKFKVDTPGFRKTAQMIIDWHKEGITPADVWVGAGGNYASAKDYFVNAQLVLYMSGSWQVGGFADAIGDKFDWTPIPNPCGDCGCTGIPGGSALMAFKATQHPAEVGKLMEYLSSEEVLGEFDARSLFIPGHLGLVKKGLDYPKNKEALNIFVAEIAKLMPEAYQLQYSQYSFALNTEIRDRLSQVIVGELTLDEAIQKIQEKMDETVK